MGRCCITNKLDESKDELNKLEETSALLTPCLMVQIEVVRTISLFPLYIWF